ncbi:MAG: UDP-N-acetylmuramate--L-alanine ligase [Holophagales bacterium]|nr:UDP-N-acetylmuramate--L-alanine ligase [Holophagales bacterium]MYG32255.1 UDP-N-acetylmuramate--L-alanine ligase [Holophagales bacterium]MYI78576.1 UDP-N-acetylmuramate--L-alanine ligase [Holophagales bacterium]
MLLFLRTAGLERVHFVGIGGAGMSGIAEILLNYRLKVSGSDLEGSETTERLAALGARIAIGHSAGNIDRADLVVISSAVPAGNEEVVAARRRGVPVVRRAQMLAELMRLKYGVAVAGTHGKTTTTSLIGTVLTEAGLDPTVIVGGRLRVSGTGARFGNSDYLVAEADEFDRSFLDLAPVIAVITNIDVDHLDTYRDLADIQDAFASFAGRVPFFGQVIACADDANVRDLLPRLADRRIVTYGFDQEADIRALQVSATPTGVRFEVADAQLGPLGVLELPMPGRHNVLNALAAVAAARAVGLDFEATARALSRFRGVHRRFERVGRWRGATVIDDYAHHPTEVEATLRAAREVLDPGGNGAGTVRIHAVFQPHLFSRTRALADDFGRALLLADNVLVADIYPSRERPIPGVDAGLVVAAGARAGHPSISGCGPWQAAADRLRSEVGEGDLVLTLGAGDIYRLAHRLAAGGGDVS